MKSIANARIFGPDPIFEMELDTAAATCHLGLPRRNKQFPNICLIYAAAL